MKLEIYTMNSFAKTRMGGNPAGVVLNSDSLLKKDMQRIAEKIGFSEIAFVKKSDRADFKVLFFTPNKEVELCGHATVATFALLLCKNIINEGIYKQETKSGVLNVECRNNKIYMEQCNPEFYKILDKRYIADTLNIDENNIMDNIPIQIVSTGLNDILIPVKSLKALYDVKPDFNKISYICSKEGAVGYHVFTMETKCSSMAHCRNFAPLYDINEESATGTSNGALGCYLYKYGIVDENSARNLVFEQGYCMGKPSEILVELDTYNNCIKVVRVGGTALNIKKKLFSDFEK
ncbi:PhzF family phenazine biosynthesis protein [Clostridium tyrobutyricum]|uniref:PhzF family phenazine biosynthesis protein n=1 Tax=Clostridium tyrobutyricum TaxID=1519 RepID=UPI0002D5ED70|nr:PhzF family phenazine biosynthesis protein [Clostridium tyrobutyricum]MBR9649185.1 PhzF family phenazine biosynthesis protein [Clostridium tyrobutyricum]MBV4439797.1 PhzF family phenazine biosynthesis protein [Clostridium tyrobutyricum]MEA5007833.1 PhzF family phenazine biosynthesis protein [Clostridium tyrobutyricum]QCH26423.1 putative isomerase YddE [Clostridium tyrobutyricum]